MSMTTMNGKYELINIELYKEGDQYYFKLQYKVTNDSGQWVLTMPRVKAPIYSGKPIIDILNIYGNSVDAVQIDFGLGYLTADTDKEGYYYKYKPTLEKLTISEIEKRLGHKIEIIAEDKQ